MSAPAAIVTVPMHTTITINGTGGSRFLAALDAHGDMPAVLAVLARGHVDSLEVELDLAEEVADWVERLIERNASTSNDDPPLLFSPNIGDGIAIVRDVLVEFQAPARRAPRIWRFVPRGTLGRVIAHHDDTDRVLIEPSREIAYVRSRCMTGARFWRPRCRART